MKKVIVTIMFSLILIASANANLVRIADDIVYQAENVREMVEGLRDRRGNKREITRELNRLKDGIRKLENRLDGRRPDRRDDRRDDRRHPRANVSASCSLDVGGNFFTPETKVLCTVYGEKAAGYEIKVDNGYSNNVKFQGQLDPNRNPQSFETREKKVGGHSARYNVYILTRGGNKVHVATLGNR